MGGESRMGGFLKVIPTASEDYEQNERLRTKMVSSGEISSERGEGQ
jgi:hypothetical protein